MTDEKSPQPLPGGIVSRHPRRPRLPILAATTTGVERNTVRVPLQPIACMRLNDGRFDFDSSVVLPEAARELAELAPFARATPRPRPAVFGHADPVGNDDYNKEISGRRARAVHALLTRDVDAWAALADVPFGGDSWTNRHWDMMLGALGFSGGSRVQAFQSTDPELVPDGILGPKTRRVLFAAYMDLLCRDENGAPYRYEPSDFLGRGANAAGRVDMQGCGELNPVLMLSTTEASTLPPTLRNKENAPNRRVVVFLFPEETIITAATWPCPGASEGSAKCQTRLWSDASFRRAGTASRRRYAETRDTFACRFYERLAFHSPCETTEGPAGPGIVTFRIRRETDGGPAAKVIAVIRMPDGSTIEEQTDDAGEVRIQGVKGERFELLDVLDPLRGDILSSALKETEASG